jgi:hypothetical protein
MSDSDKVFIPEWGDGIRDGETVCGHNRRPFECVICYPKEKTMVRCKVVCSQVQKFDEGSVVHFYPVYSGSEENKQFFAQTPGGVVNFNIIRKETADRFEIGKEYYVDISPAA